MAVSDTASNASRAVEEFVEAFAAGWRTPVDADHFADHFEPWLDPEVRLVAPQMPTLVGLEAFRERFVRPLFELVPDLHGTIEGWAASGETVYIELRLQGTIGRRRVELLTCDRITLRDGRVIERVAHLDPLPMLFAVALTPRAWPRALRQRLAGRRATR